MPRVMHFEINAPDPDGLMDFYKDAFGWEIAKWEAPEDYWLLTTGEDGQPGIKQRDDALARRSGAHGEHHRRRIGGRGCRQGDGGGWPGGNAENGDPRDLLARVLQRPPGYAVRSAPRGPGGK